MRNADVGASFGSVIPEEHWTLTSYTKTAVHCPKDPANLASAPTKGGNAQIVLKNSLRS